MRMRLKIALMVEIHFVSDCPVPSSQKTLFLRNTMMYGFDENGQPNGHTWLEEEVIDTAVGYIYEPLLPQIRIEYYEATRALTQVRVEKYTYIDGAYRRTNAYVK